MISVENTLLCLARISDDGQWLVTAKNDHQKATSNQDSAISSGATAAKSMKEKINK
jgi:hypothetical protein